jgi:hypothetical protein
LCAILCLLFWLWSVQKCPNTMAAVDGDLCPLTVQAATDFYCFVPGPMSAKVSGVRCTVHTLLICS